MEVFRALGTLIEAPAAEHARVAAALGLPAVPTAAEHARVVVQQRYPYASVYLGAEGMMGGEARDRIEGFRRALGLDLKGEPGRSVGSSADHLASLLGLLATMDEWRREESDSARRTLLAEARVTLAWEHLASWAGPYLASFEECGVAFYEAWALLLRDSLARLDRAMAFPDYLPAALRAAPRLADPRREGGPAFIGALLAPARTGMILLRDDLLRLADETGLACRAGERRYVLNSFLAQDPGAALKWLAAHAEEWGGRVAPACPAPIARWWSERAAETTGLLRDLAADVQNAPSGVQNAPVREQGTSSAVQNAAVDVHIAPSDVHNAAHGTLAQRALEGELAVQDATIGVQNAASEVQDAPSDVQNAAPGAPTPVSSSTDAQ